MRNLMTGLEILFRNATESEPTWATDNQRIYVSGPKSYELPEQDVIDLQKLGWFYDDLYESWYIT